MPQDIVISGISGRFPDSDSIDEFKYNLYNGIDMVSEDDTRWPVGLWGLPSRNGKVKSFDKFDADFFDFEEKEVEFVDPQERLLMELTYEAIFDSGLNPKDLENTRTGFFSGSCFQEWHEDYEDPATVPSYPAHVATRVPAFFGFKGPLCHTDTACCSGLSAINEAFMAMKSGLCDQALVTGSNSLFTARISTCFRDLGMINKEGKCKCLDNNASGYVRSEALGVVFLQKASEAKRVYATILHSKSTSDGFKPEGITFPSMTSQRKLLQDTMDEAGVDPAEIGYVEAHVTGTQAGDPVELNALYDVICAKREDPVYVGCLKSNMGHAEGASGLCAIAKAILILEDRLIPPNLHYTSPNTNVRGLMDGKLIPVTKVTPLSGNLVPISSFGFGGANAHLLLKGHDKRVTHMSYNITDPIPRLVLTCGRTHESVAHILEYIVNNISKVTKDFLYLINETSKSLPQHGLKSRGFLIIEKGDTGYEFKMTIEDNVQSKPFVLFFRGPGTKRGTSSMEALLLIDIFRQSIDNSAMILKAVNVDLVKIFEKDKFSPMESIIVTTALQIAFVDLLIDLDVKPDQVSGQSTGHLGCAYLEGSLSAAEAILGSHLMATTSDRNLLRTGLNKILGKKTKQRKYVSSDYFISQIDNNSDESLIEKPDFCIQLGVNGIEAETNNNQVVAILNMVGTLYNIGFNPKIERLYPKVDLPVPSPTPGLSSLFKWDHRKCYSLRPYTSLHERMQTYASNNSHFSFEKSVPEDEFLFDHRIDERTLFPATGYLMLVWTAFTKMKAFSIATIFEDPIEFKDVTFMQATVMPDSRDTRFTVKIDNTSGSFVVKNGDIAVVKGTIGVVAKSWETSAPICPKRVHSEDNFTLHSQDIYRELRVRGYDYGPYFRGVYEAAADGSEGKVIWRQTLPKDIRKALAIGEGQEGKQQDILSLWLKNWIPYVDSLLQFQLFGLKTGSRSLVVPTGIESLLCFPNALNEAIRDGDTILDTVNSDESSLVRAFFDPHQDIVWTQGLVIKGMKTSAIPRKHQLPQLEKYQFVPYTEAVTVDAETKTEVDIYYKECLSMVRALNTGQKKTTPSIDLDLSDSRHSLLRILSHQHRGLESSISGLKDDLLVGDFTSEWYLQETLFKPQLHTVINNVIHDSVTQNLDILEVNFTEGILSKRFVELLDESVLYDILDFRYKVAHPFPSQVKAATEVKDIIKWTGNRLDADVSPQHLVILRTPQDASLDSKEVLEYLYTLTREGGFLLIVNKEPTINRDFERALNGHNPIASKASTSSQLIKAAEKTGYVLVGKRCLYDKLLPLDSILLRRAPKELSTEVQKVIPVGLMDTDLWLEELQSSLTQCSKDSSRRVWLVPKYGDSLSEGHLTGIYGLVKSLSLEQAHGDRIRCIIDSSNCEPINFETPKYKRLLEMDLIFNVFSGQCLGSYEHLEVFSMGQKNSPMYGESNNAYLKVLKPGDLTSFAWAQNSPVTGADAIRVYYAPLNFKDVMYATGSLQPDHLPGLIPGDLPIGLEFAGLDVNNNRVMGIVPFKGLATHLSVHDEDFLWPVPEHWSLEEAATVPVVYSTAYYALVIRGHLMEGESVLIHAGAGGVGLAAINICIRKRCTIYTTVGSVIKRQYLLKQFPQLIAENIFNSRDIRFEEDVLKSTDGRGVDIVLNSLSHEKLRAGLNCLGPNGRFLEIGKVDFVEDSCLHGWQTDENKSFHGILLDMLFTRDPEEPLSKKLLEEKKLLRNLVLNGTRDGTVQPLNRTVFDTNHVEDAFRFLSTGKHIGKVLIKMQDEMGVNLPPSLPVLKATYFDAHKSYLIVGGLGGFGLEIAYWLVERGARKLLLSSRRGVTEPYQKYSIRRLERMGCIVAFTQKDAKQSREAREMVEAANRLGPVGGIFSCAIDNVDALIENQTVETFRKASEPKSNLTLYLDIWSRKLCPQLHCFVCCSSLSCGRGNHGQTNYNYGNSVMETICEKRSKDGLHGLAIQWGVIGDVGLVAEKTGGSTDIVLLGSKGQRMPSMLSTLDRFIQTNLPVCSSLVRSGRMSSKATNNMDILKSIYHIIGIKDISKIDPNANLGSFGIDSMIAIEIRQTLERSHGKSMSFKEIRELTIKQLMDMSSGAVEEFIPEDDPVMSHSKETQPPLFTDIRLPLQPLTLLKEGSGAPIFLVPSFDGNFEPMVALVQNLGSPVVGINWTYNMTAISDWDSLAGHVLQLILDYLKPEQCSVRLLGHSFGGLLSLQLASKVKGLNSCETFLWDCCPKSLKESAAKFVINNKYGSGETEILVQCMQRLAANLDVEATIGTLALIANTVNRDIEVRNILSKALVSEEDIEACIKFSHLLYQKLNFCFNFIPPGPGLGDKADPIVDIPLSDMIAEKLRGAEGRHKLFVSDNLLSSVDTIKDFFNGTVATAKYQTKLPASCTEKMLVL